MDANITSASLHAITRFANALERYQRTAQDFFAPGLLRILADSFEWKNLGLTFYNGDKFLGCHGINQAKYLKDIYPCGLYQQDVFAKYITRRMNTAAPASSPVIWSSEVATQTSGDFDVTLNIWSRAGLRYAATLAFPTHRISFYKSADEADFTELELTNLTCIYSILSEQWTSFQERQGLQLCSAIKNLSLTDMNLNFIVFDEWGNPLEYNGQVLALLQRLCETDHLQQIFHYLLTAFWNEGSHPAPKLMRGYTVRMNTISRVDSFHMIKRYYCFMITRPSTSADMSQETVELLGQLTSREWEVLAAFCSGSDYHQVAKSLYISESTVRTHLKNIYRKLHVDNQRSLIRLYSQYEQTVKVQ